VRPLIGLSTYREMAAWGVWRERADVLHSAYADQVAAAGGQPVLLPPATSDMEAAVSIVARLDGLVISGGADVDPKRYAAAPHERTAGWREDRDAWELSLLSAADAAGLPVLGVCRGMQLMAVHAGGRLHQHTPDVVGHEEHSPGGAAYGLIEVQTEDHSLLQSLVGRSLSVPCHHHQSVAEHPGFQPAAYASDGTLEAMERGGARFCLAVQWHPEAGQDDSLLRALVNAATAN
jgi:putative glutamine amidotransferase